ncbi:MAG TPA: SpoIIE family protein phosphatase [Polyangiaceae bacterium]
MSPISDRAPNVLPPGVVFGTIPGPRASDVIEIVDHRDGTLELALLDVRAPRGQEHFQERLANAVRAGLELRLPLHEIARSLRSVISLAVAASVGATILRLSEAEERVELLNAGMPPVACVFPDGRLLSLPALSSDVGPRSPGAHPYEMMPWIPGAVWVLASDGATVGSVDDAGTLWSSLGLPEHAATLPDVTPEELKARFARGLSALPVPEDASVVVADARSRVRFSAPSLR